MTKYVTIETDKGTIKAELYTEKAPITTKNFIYLANSGFYNGLKFHRVEPNFVIQGGDPKGDGTGGSGKNIPLEINKDLTHVEGALAMARSQDPNSASSQFYITLAPTPFLDGSYAVFGKVVSGMEAVNKIQVGDKMNRVYITDK
ncbi:MAG: peptidylprolyl isomerase [Nanoarchaeota archaeon]